MPAAYTCMPSVQVWDFEDNGLLIRHARLVCDFCSSGQRFACGFLQTPPRDGRPCRPANSSPCRVCRGLAPPSRRALPGAPKKKQAPVKGACPIQSDIRKRRDYLTTTTSQSVSETLPQQSVATTCHVMWSLTPPLSQMVMQLPSKVTSQDSPLSMTFPFDLIS